MQAGKIGSSLPVGGLAMPHRRVFATRRVKANGLRWPVVLFLLTLVVPWMFYFGELRMSAYRVVLLVMLLPCLVMWMRGKAGPLRLGDFAVLLYSFWVTLSLSAVHGFEPSVKTSGIIVIETLGGYLLARCYIRDADDFHNFIKLMFGIVLLLLPFAAFEFFTGQNVSRNLFELVMPTPEWRTMPSRSGLSRVQSVFDHPILFGALTGSVFALVYLVLCHGKSMLQRGLMAGVVAVTSFMSLSAGPMISLFVQSFLLCWNGLLHGIRFRWQLLIALVVSVVVAIELLADRSTVEIAVSYFLFEPISYWGRKMIWDFGTASVANHPLFGVGMDDWERPRWLGSGSSIDNFWLFLAVKYGLPAPLLMALIFFSIFLAVSRKKGLDARVAACRTAFLITLTSFFVVAWTVHFWDSAYVVFLFLMGSGVWMLDVNAYNRSAWERQRV